MCKPMYNHVLPCASFGDLALVQIRLLRHLFGLMAQVRELRQIWDLLELAAGRAHAELIELELA